MADVLLIDEELLADGFPADELPTGGFRCGEVQLTVFLRNDLPAVWFQIA
jgi:hypothetical protein